MKSPLALLLLALASPLAAAAPPPGHPPVDAAPHGAAAESGHQGRVLSSLDAGQYTYIEVSEKGKTLWIAAPAVVVRAGNTIRFEDGMVMTNFHSKLLNRTFPSVIFVGGVVVTGSN